MLFSERGLAAGRIAAALVHRHPALRIELRHPDRVLAEVAWPCPGGPPLRSDDDEPHAIHPCAFRSGMTMLWNRWQDDDLPQAPPEDEPVVSLDVAPGGAVLASGIARIPAGDHTVYAFGTTLDLTACQEVANDVAGPQPAPPGVAGLGLGWDRDLGVTITHVDTAPGTGTDLSDEVEAEILELLEDLMARYASVQLIRELSMPQSADDSAWPPRF